jgi:hypothetical protein
VAEETKKVVDVEGPLSVHGTGFATVCTGSSGSTSRSHYDLFHSIGTISKGAPAGISIRELSSSKEVPGVVSISEHDTSTSGGLTEGSTSEASLSV